MLAQLTPRPMPLPLKTERPPLRQRLQNYKDSIRRSLLREGSLKKGHGKSQLTATFA
jgi:hypothetical protein